MFRIDTPEWRAVEANLKRLDYKTKSREIKKILRRQAKPVQRTMQELTPIGKGPKRGNLKKSIGIFTTRSKDFPGVVIGPGAGKRRKNDGYYGFFVAHGTKGYKAGQKTSWGRKVRGKSTRGNRGIKANDFLTKTRVAVGNMWANGMSRELERFINREAKKLGFE